MSAPLDETGWRQGDQCACLWVAMTTWVTVFVLRLSRSGHVARELLSKTFQGILVTDHFSAYKWYIWCDGTLQRSICVTL